MCSHFLLLNPKEVPTLNTKIATKQIRIKQWAEIFQDRSNSGQKILDYCTSHGITKDQYYYWLRKVRSAAIEANPSLVELPQNVNKLQDVNEQHDKPVMVINKGSLSISVNANLPSSMLAQLIGYLDAE